MCKVGAHGAASCRRAALFQKLRLSTSEPLKTTPRVLLLTKKLLRLGPLHFVVKSLRFVAVTGDLGQRKASTYGEDEAHRKETFSCQGAFEQDDAGKGADGGQDEGDPGHVEEGLAVGMVDYCMTHHSEFCAELLNAAPLVRGQNSGVILLKPWGCR